MAAVDHVVLGAGAVGIAVVEALARRGESVRVVNRSGLREPVAGVQSVAGDVSDPAFAASATHGARVVYQALNPPYHRWAQEFPGLQAAAIAAAQAAGARLVAMDNVYMYGRANGTAVHRGPRLRPAHAQGPRPRRNGPRPDGRPRRRSRPGHRRPGVGLLRAARRRAVLDRRLGGPAGAGRQARVGDGRPRHAAHLHVHPRHRRKPRPRSANATTRSDASGTCPVPRRAPPATSSPSSTRPPAPSRG